MNVGDLIWLGQQLVDAGHAEVHAGAPDVPIAELIVMGDALRNPGSTIGDLAKRTGYAQSRVSTAVAGLGGRGWVETRADPDDGRRTVVVVPDSVRREARAYQRRSETQALDGLLAAVPPGRRPSIVEALEELLEALRRQAEEDGPGDGRALHRGLRSAQRQPPG